MFAGTLVSKEKIILSGSCNSKIKKLGLRMFLSENFSYSPPLLWGRSGHLQTASYGLFGHTSLIRTYDFRHVVKLNDGASVVFDIFEPVKQHSSRSKNILTSII